MRSLSLIILLTSITNIFSQDADTLSNSLNESIKESYPTLSYTYFDSSQTHDYSNNWDLDGDGINDEVYFVGTGGAHVYYFLKVVLSTDQESREFSFVESDFPLLTGTDTINLDQTPIGFVVAELGKSKTPSIIVRLDNQSYHASKEILHEKNVTTKNIVISFVDGKTEYSGL